MQSFTEYSVDTCSKLQNLIEARVTDDSIVWTKVKKLAWHIDVPRNTIQKSNVDKLK